MTDILMCERLDKVIDRLDTIIQLLSTPKVVFDPAKLEDINLDDLKPSDLIHNTGDPPPFAQFDSRGNLYPAAEERLEGSMDVAESTDLEGE